MPIRPLVFFSALAGGDYLLWNTSLTGGHEVLALVAGLALPPLLLACVLVLLLAAVRALLGSRSLGRGARWIGMRQTRARRARRGTEPTEVQSPGRRAGSDQRGAARSGKLAA